MLHGYRSEIEQAESTGSLCDKSHRKISYKVLGKGLSSHMPSCDQLEGETYWTNRYGARKLFLISYILLIAPIYWIYGIGNLGTALTAFGAPVVANLYGWGTAIRLYMILLGVLIIVI